MQPQIKQSKMAEEKPRNANLPDAKTSEGEPRDTLTFIIRLTDFRTTKTYSKGTVLKYEPVVLHFLDMK
jgi:hypothetical protein